MASTTHANPFPRGALLGAAGLIAVAIGAAALSRSGSLGMAEPAAVRVVHSRDLLFVDRPEGGIAIRAAATGGLIHVIAPGEGGFIRGVLRSLVRERRRAEQAPATPFRLTLWEDGRFTISDPATGRVVDLGGFGPTNLAAFTDLLSAAEEAR